MSKKVPLTPKELQQKRFEASVQLLGSALGNLGRFNAIGEDKQLESLVHNCIYLADHLIHELGYTAATDPETAQVRTLKSILESGEE